jgi:signal transduction histidine kinase
MQLVFSDFQDQLVRGLTHRMNNILSVFHGYLGLLMDDRKLDPMLREGLSRIRESARDASELVERINAISRPTSCHHRDIHLPDFFRQLGPSLDTLRSPAIQLTVECPQDLPRIRVDVSRMKLAILELLRNAHEAAASRVVIRVTANGSPLQTELFPVKTAPVPEHWVKIEVIDDGPGIPSSEARRIFEPFFSTKKNAQSAGLGLAVALGCAQQFGGALECHSRRGETVFEMTLPASMAPHLSAVA